MDERGNKERNRPGLDTWSKAWSLFQCSKATAVEVIDVRLLRHRRRLRTRFCPSSQAKENSVTFVSLNLPFSLVSWKLKNMKEILWVSQLYRLQRVSQAIGPHEEATHSRAGLEKNRQPAAMGLKQSNSPVCLGSALIDEPRHQRCWPMHVLDGRCRTTRVTPQSGSCVHKHLFEEYWTTVCVFFRYITANLNQNYKKKALMTNLK
jgi:hypothetical protein